MTRTHTRMRLIACLIGLFMLALATGRGDAQALQHGNAWMAVAVPR